ncbi:hypothetical protein RIF29_19310 [Crotalaria pallida]|uniref:Uncharacterized protein n=1 Tax=Crotalaria pallida TaxID=3830 RepID=A0AAN9F1I6_CROPI
MSITTRWTAPPSHCLLRSQEQHPPSAALLLRLNDALLVVLHVGCFCCTTKTKASRSDGDMVVKGTTAAAPFFILPG